MSKATGSMFGCIKVGRHKLFNKYESTAGPGSSRDYPSTDQFTQPLRCYLRAEEFGEGWKQQRKPTLSFSLKIIPKGGQTGEKEM